MGLRCGEVYMVSLVWAFCGRFWGFFCTGRVFVCVYLGLFLLVFFVCFIFFNWGRIRT